LVRIFASDILARQYLHTCEFQVACTCRTAFTKALFQGFSQIVLLGYGPFKIGNGKQIAHEAFWGYSMN